MFEIICNIGSWAAKVAHATFSVLVIVAVFGVVTASTFFGFYFLSSGVVALASLLAVILALALGVWSISFMWKLVRLFFPKIEPLGKTGKA